MRRRRWLAGALLTAALLLGPAMAGAGPAPLSVTQYQELLRGVIADLEAGRAVHLQEVMVETPSGPVTVDLRPLGQASPRAALPVARQYLRAAESDLVGTADPTARQDLAQILAAQRAKGKVNNWLQRLIVRLLFGTDERGGVAAVLAQKQTYWIGGAIGLIGLSVLGFFLWRSLKGHGAGADLAARLGRGARPDRPLTPDELWAEARELAAAGEWTAALRGGYIALLHALDKQGLIRYVPAQTNREHERQLRRSQPALAPAFATLTALVESRLFGGVAATAEDFEAGASLIQQLWREGDALSRRADATPGASSSAPSR
jgi:hypothetical protein